MKMGRLSRTSGARFWKCPMTTPSGKFRWGCTEPFCTGWKNARPSVRSSWRKARGHHCISGSPQEFDWTRILGCFLEDHEFGTGRGHALGLQKEVTLVLVARATAEQ